MKRAYLKWIILTLAVLVNVFILVNAGINGAISSQESGWFANFAKNVVNTFIPNYINEANFDLFALTIRKAIGHFSLFLLDGVLSTLALHLFLKDTKFGLDYYSVSFSLIVGLVVAMISELIQIFTPDRFGSWADIGIDFGGYLVGLALLIVILVFSNQIKFKKE